MVQEAAAREAVDLVEDRVAEDKPQAGEGERRSGSSWMGEDTEEDTAAVRKEVAVRTATGAVVQPAGTGHTQPAAGGGNSRNMLVAAVVVVVEKRPEDKLGSTAAVVHQGDKPVVVAEDRIL